jgi:hypothetical protein
LKYLRGYDFGRVSYRSFKTYDLTIRSSPLSHLRRCVMGDLIAVVVLIVSVMWVLHYAIARWSDIWPNNRREEKPVYFARRNRRYRR